MQADPVPPFPAVPFRPTLRFLFAHPAHLIALGFGSGLPRRAPGTVGTLWAWVAFLVMQRWLSSAMESPRAITSRRVTSTEPPA